MVLIPEAGISNALPIRMMAEPIGGWPVERGFCEVAQKGDCAAFYVRSAAIWSRLIFDRNPEERHVGDMPTNLAFQRKFTAPNWALRFLSLAPSRIFQSVASN